MPLDPRIALQGIQWQAPDVLGAVRQGQDIRKNQMVMDRQAAADEALFNYFNPPPGAGPMNVSAADQIALRGFQDVFASMPAGVGRGPPITVQPLPSAGAPPASRMASRAAAAVASAVAPPAAPAPPMANAMRAAPADVRSAMMARMAPAGARPDISTLMPFADDPRVKAVLDQRAAEDERTVEATEKRQKVEQEQFTRTVAGVLANPDDASLAAAAQQYPQFAQDIGRIAQMPFEQRAAALTSLMATLPGGADFVKLFAPDPKQINRGGSIVTVDMNPLSPTYGRELRTDTVTADPTKYNDVPTANGIVRVYADGRTEVLRGPDGQPLTEAPDPVEQRRVAEAETEAEAERKADVVRTTSAYGSTQNVRSQIAAALPLVNVFSAGLMSATSLVGGSPAANLKAALTSIGANLAFGELARMRAESATGGALGQIVIRELELLESVKDSISQAQGPEELRAALRNVDRQLLSVERAYANMLGLPPAGERGDTLQDRETNRTYVSDGTRWVMQ
jgi:hypothetical protein